MKVVEFKTTEDTTRYYLTDDKGLPVESVLQYLKFKDNVGYAGNTLRMHCIHLKHYFTFLEESEKDYEKVSIDDLSRFIAWLKNPDIYCVTKRFSINRTSKSIYPSFRCPIFRKY